MKGNGGQWLTMVFVLWQKIVDGEADHPVGNGEEEGNGWQDPVVELPLSESLLI